MFKRIYEKIKKRKKTGQQKNGGFTLVELLVAIVILAMVMMPISRLFITAGSINNKGRKEQQANITANSVLESARAFAIYEFDKQCRANTASSFKLIAAKDNSAFSSSVFTQYDSTNTTPLATNFVVSGQTYAYKINGLTQNKSKYDAVVIFEKDAYQTVKTDSSTSISESDVSGKFATYNKQYNIRVYIYEHGTDVSSEDYTMPDGKPVKGNALVVLTGSKLDNAQIPT